MPNPVRDASAPAKHEPGRFVLDTHVLRQLDGRYAKGVGRSEEHCDQPLPQRHTAGLHNGAGSNGEPATAVVASVWHRLAGLDHRGAVRRCQGRLKTARFRGGWLVGDLLSFASELVALSFEDDDVCVVD